MKRRLIIGLALASLSAMLSCQQKPVIKKKEQAFVQAAEPPSCAKGDLADCVERGRKLFQEAKVERAERFYQKACDYEEYAGCVGLAEISLSLKTPLHRNRAKAFLEQACNAEYWEACYRIGTEEALIIAPPNRNKYLEQACRGGIAMSCAALGERYEKYSNQLAEAARYYTLACDYGLSEYCKKKAGLPPPPPPSKNSREIFLKRFPSDKRIGTFFQVSAGPCSEKSCPFHISLEGPDGHIGRRSLPWSAGSGPVDRAGGSSLNAGVDEGFVGTFVKRVGFGPHLDGVEVMQEMGMQKVQHRSDVYLQVENQIVQIPWTEAGVRSKENPPELLATVIGIFDSEKEAIQAHKNFLGTICSADIFVFSTNYFPKQKYGKWLLGSISTGKDRAFQLIDKWRLCYAQLTSEVHLLF